MKTKLSVVVIAGSEEHNISECLGTVTWADEIVVVCSNRSDRTMELARALTDSVHYREFDTFAAQRRYGLSLASFDWVLGLDADERITVELRDEIQSMLEAPDADGYRIARRNYFVGKWMRHGGWHPDYQLRLVRKAKCRVSDRLVHEGYIVDGNVHKLSAPMDHYTDPTILHHLRKNLEYSRLEASEKRRRVHAFNLLIHPLSAFLSKYIAQAGWRDGMHGLAAALIHAINDLQSYLFMWELESEKGKEM